MTNVLLLYEILNPSVRLCAYEQLNFLYKLGKIVFKHSSFRNVTQEECVESDVVILVRSDSDMALQLVKTLKKRDKYIVYVLDDDILDIADGLVSSKYYKSVSVQKRIKKIMSYCDMLLSPSELLLQKYKGYFHTSAIIEEPALGEKRKSTYSKNLIKIGFAGSIDRKADVESILTNTIHEIVNKYKDKVVFEFFGAKPDIVDELNLKYYPYTENYELYQKKLGELNWDIGLAPMPNTNFHQCKHYNKYIEYSAHGIIGIYSNIMPYTKIIKNGVNGILCNNVTQEWTKAISYLIDNEIVRKELLDNIENIKKEKFSLEIVSKQYMDAVPELLTYTSHNSKRLPLNVIKLRYDIIRIINFICRNKLKTPVRLFQKITNN